MNIALIHYRVGETDGVSLEMDKWRIVLEKMGHKTFYVAGSSGTCDAIIIPELYYRDEYDLMLNEECFVALKNFNESTLRKAIIERAEKVEKELISIIKDNNIELLIPNNVLSLGRSIHIAMGITNAIKKTGVKVVGHHHDFYWERQYFGKPTTSFVKEQLEKYFPPKELSKTMKHVVINKAAKLDLKDKKGLESLVVPNVFDFKAPLWEKDDYNKDFKEKLGVKENQILLLQATRVTNRKAIELAIDLVANLSKSHNIKKMVGKKLYDGRVFTHDTEFVLALVGLHEGGQRYEEKLIEYAKEKGINMIVNPNLVNHSRYTTEEGEKVYSLWDAYVYCDIITYPSIYEGWGNQFLEGLFAKKPQVVFEYSIFESDIKEKGFNIISLGSDYKTRENGLVKIDDSTISYAVDKTIEILLNEKTYNHLVEENFKIGATYFSMQALEEKLQTLFL